MSSSIFEGFIKSTWQRLNVVDKSRILQKLDELDSYLKELKEVVPPTFKAYQQIEKKRSCEWLLQLCIECILDICKMCVAGLRLGLPSEENNVFEKIRTKGIISDEMKTILEQMRGFRNILVREYAVVDDELVFRFVTTRLDNFHRFKTELLAVIR